MPFKVTELKNLKSCMEGRRRGTGGLRRPQRHAGARPRMTQALSESSVGGDFSAFWACEEARDGSVGAPHPLPRPSGEQWQRGRRGLDELGELARGPEEEPTGRVAVGEAAH
ncbi:unnamed protein product [Urochloa humidicola]